MTTITDIYYFEWKGYYFTPSPVTKFNKPPFAYKRVEGDNSFFYPDEQQIPLLVQAFNFVTDGGSLRDGAKWLQEKTGRSISHSGLRKIWGYHNDPTLVERFQNAKQAQRGSTQKEIARKARNRKKGQVKRAITLKEKTLDKLEKQEDQEKQKEYEQSPQAHLEPQAPASMEKNSPLSAKGQESKDLNVVFQPNQGPQTDFLRASEREVLYGGAAGGGKSYALLADPTRYFDNKNFRGLLLRRTNDELGELKWKSKELYKNLYPKAQWKEKESKWLFPSGAELWMSYLDRDEDVLRYQGQSFTWIGVDELTQYPTSFAWDYLRSRLRTTDPTLDLSMRGTTNPGGPGHGWVKQMFIDPAPENTSFVAKDSETGEDMVFPSNHEKAGQPLFKRRFIPAFLKDNPYLTQDANYEAALLSMPEQQRKQLLEGDWSIPEGAAFPEFKKTVHVTEPIEIPREWRRFRSCDFGYSSYSAVHWYAVDPAFETLYVYREMYVSRCTATELAQKIKDVERENLDSVSYGVLDSSCWNDRGTYGPTIAEEMIAQGVKWRPSDRSAGSRVQGRMKLHELLKYDNEYGVPGIIFFNTCRQIISDLQVIPTDPKGTDDIDPRFASDHAYDSIRYGIMSRPRSHVKTNTIRKTPKAAFDPVFGY